MGICSSEEGQPSHHGRKPDKGNGRNKRGGEVRLMLIGPAQSGKSTFKKQLLRIHNGDLDVKARRDYAEAVNVNIRDAIQGLINISRTYGNGMNNSKLAYDKSLEPCAEKVMQYFKVNDEGRISREIGELISQIWEDPSIKACYKDIDDPEYNLPDSTTYFMAEINRICQSGYIPTMEDIIRVRWTTTGAPSESFEFAGYTVTLVDLGGQLSERRKWNRCIEDSKGATAVLFLGSLSGFHKKCIENQGITQLEEAFEIFKEFVPKLDENTHVILILNKFDLFREEIGNRDITDCPLLKDYKGDLRNTETTLNFIQHKFYQLYQEMRPGSLMHSHASDATHEDVVQQIFWDITDSVLRFSLKNSGFI
eukprot:jgi/Bigna1/52232/estExt_Genewise1Plus.C_60210